MDALLRILPGPQPLLMRYGATTGLVLVSFALRLGVEERVGTYGFILFIPAIVAAPLLFDRSSGFLALVLSLGLLIVVLPWGDNLDLHIAALASFALVGAGLVLVGDALRRALDHAQRVDQERNLLLQEMSHRVKNKFAMIISIISLQARQAAPETRAALEAVALRVKVIASAHEHLQLARHDGLVDMSDYLGGLCRFLGDTLSELRPITVSLTADDIELPPEKALLAGLVVNELVTNAFKYAFTDDRPGTIRVALARHGSGLELTVADDGLGCPQNSAPGLGTKLVTLLAAQLGGSATWQQASPGCKVTVTFPAHSLDGTLLEALAPGRAGSRRFPSAPGRRS